MSLVPYPFIDEDDVVHIAVPASLQNKRNTTNKHRQWTICSEAPVFGVYVDDESRVPTCLRCVVWANPYEKTDPRHVDASLDVTSRFRNRITLATRPR